MATLGEGKWLQVVKHVLKDHVGTARSLVGVSATEDKIMELMEEPGVRTALET